MSAHNAFAAPRAGTTRRPIPVDAASNDIAATHSVVQVASLDATAETLRRRGIPLGGNDLAILDSGIRAVRVPGPDGHLFLVEERAVATLSVPVSSLPQQRAQPLPGPVPRPNALWCWPCAASPLSRQSTKAGAVPGVPQRRLLLVMLTPDARYAGGGPPDFLRRNWRVRSAIWSACSSRAKWPPSSRCTCAPGTSRW